MKKNKFKKFFIVLMVLGCFFLIGDFAFAEINPQYSQEGVEFTQEDDGIFAKILSFGVSLLLEIIGFTILGIFWIVEKLVAVIVGMLTGAGGLDKFPWADLTIFNGMAILDINFINPAKGSLFMDSNGDYTTIGNAVRSVYFSGMSIALGFLGIIVAVMAIRLAISSIASEKAKYKESIGHWVTALVLLFGMHYLISFIFYLNEQLVQVASSIVQGVLTDNATELSFLNSATQTGLGIDKMSSLTLMGEYFKNEASKGIENFGEEMFLYSILYAVFILQSLMIFWSYWKRFFYVMILAVIAPFVVIYDFFVNSIS